jgi:hypothetical protein
MSVFLVHVIFILTVMKTPSIFPARSKSTHRTMLFTGEYGQNQQTNAEEALAISQVANQFLESFDQVTLGPVEYGCQNEVGDLKPCKIFKYRYILLGTICCIMVFNVAASDKYLRGLQ